MVKSHLHCILYLCIVTFSQNVFRCIIAGERRGSVVDSMPAWHAGDLGSILGPGMLY